MCFEIEMFFEKLSEFERIILHLLMEDRNLEGNINFGVNLKKLIREGIQSLRRKAENFYGRDYICSVLMMEREGTEKPEIHRFDPRNSFPPEKYYEACITYHILRYFEEVGIGRIFPFSISQIRENTEGYDFGYYLEDQGRFFIQYKRPYYGSSVWQIDIRQLKTIIKNGIEKITYYAFPDFHDIFEWYTGLENTFFLSAADLATQIRLKKMKGFETVQINKREWRLKRFDDYFSRKTVYGNILAERSEENGKKIDLSSLQNDSQGYKLQKVVNFDFAFAEENMKPVFDEWKERCFSVCRRSPNLLYPEDNWMLMGCDEKGRYMGQEVSEEELQRALERTEILVVPFDEFDKSADRPEYFSWNGTPLLVIFQDFYQCERWLEDVLEEDLFVVDLYPKEVKNFYTMLFFRKRKAPDIIYVFPTLKYLAEKLPEKLRQKVVFSEEQESLQMFSCLGDEIRMLRVIRWLMSFLSGAGGENSGEQAASVLSLGFVRSLIDSAMREKRDEYWRYKSSLPTTETVSDGFYALMEFQGRENTGKMCSQEYQGKGCPMLFMKKEDAETYLNHRPQNEKWKLVAVDDCYWKVLKEYLQTGDVKWCLYLNPNQGMILDVERYEQVLDWVRMRRAEARFAL